MNNGTNGSTPGRGFPVAERMTAEMVEKAAATYRTLQEVARAAGQCGQPAFSRALNANPDLKKAYDRGRAQYAATNGSARSMPPRERIKPQNGNGLSRPTAKPVAPAEPRSSIVMEAEPAGNGAQSGLVIKLGSGRIAVGIEIDLLNSSREDRDTINDFVDAVQAIQASRASGVGA